MSHHVYMEGVERLSNRREFTAKTRCLHTIFVFFLSALIAFNNLQRGTKGWQFYFFPHLSWLPHPPGVTQPHVNGP